MLNIKMSEINFSSQICWYETVVGWEWWLMFLNYQQLLLVGSRLNSFRQLWVTGLSGVIGSLNRKTSGVNMKRRKVAAVRPFSLDVYFISWSDSGPTNVSSQSQHFLDCITSTSYSYMDDGRVISLTIEKNLGSILFAIQVKQRR